MMPILKSTTYSRLVARTNFRFNRVLFGALGAALLSGLTAHATSATWSGAGANDSWGTGGAGGNWGGAAAPGSTTGTSTDTASFTSVVGNSATVNIDNGDQNIGSLSFASTAAAFTIGGAGANSGNSLFLNSGGSITNASANTQTINAPLVLVAATTGSYTITDSNATAAADINIAGNISTSATGAFALNLSGNNSTVHTSTLSGIISNGTNGGTLAVNLLSSSSSQTYLLSGVNTYSGGTTISSGTIVINADSGLGADPSSPQANNVVISGATLNATTAGTISLNANRGIEVGNTGGTVTSGTITAGAGTSLVLNGSITNADSAATDTVVLSSVTTSTVTLGGSVLNTSGAEITAGTLLSNGGSIGTASLTISNGTLLLASSTSVSGGIGFVSQGAIASSVSNATLSGGALSINAALVHIDVPNAGLLTISNNITGSGTIWSATSSTGTVQFTGNNTYTGTTELDSVSGGGAEFNLDVDGNSSALGSSLVLYQWTGSDAVVNSSATAVTLQNNVQFESGQTYLTATTATGGQTSFFGGSGNITFEGTDTVLGGYATVGGIDYNGTAVLTFEGATGVVGTGAFGLTNLSGSAGLTTFTLSGANGELVFDNDLVDTTAASSETSSVRFAASSTNNKFILAGNNSYTGSTTFAGATTTTFVVSGNNTTTGANFLTGGTLDINSTTALGSGALNITTGTDTIDNTTASPITVSNNVVLSASVGYGGTQNLTMGSLSTVNAFASGTITLGTTGSTNSNLTFTSLVNTGTSTSAPGYILTVNENAVGESNTLTLNSVQLSATGNTVTANDTFVGNGDVVIGGFTNGGSTAASNFTYDGTGTATINTTGITGTLTEKLGTMILSSSTGGSGAVTLSGGTLDVNNNGALGTAILNLSTAATIDNTSLSAVSVTNTATFATTGSFTYGGTNALTVAQLNTATNFASGTITLAGTNTLTISSLVNTGTSTTPSYSMTVNGAGNTLALGTVQLSATGNTATALDTFLGTGNVAIGGFTNGGSTLPSSFIYNGSGTATIANTTGVTGSLTEKTGTMILSGNNTGETGTLSLIGGTLDINNAKALTATAVNNFGAIGAAGTAATFDNTSGIAITETLNPNVNLYQAATFVGSKSLNMGTGSVTIETATATGITITDANAVTLGIGTLQSSLGSNTTFGLTDSGGNNTFAISNLVLNTSATTAFSMTLGGNANITVGTISGGKATDSFIYNNSGTLTITGSTTFTGGTSISSGAGSSGEIYVASGATLTAGTGTTVAVSNGNLGGLGTVNGLVTLGGAGTINLVDGKIGTLSIGSLSTTQGGDMNFEIGTGNQGTDKLAIGGTFTDTAGAGSIFVTLDNLNGAGSQTITSGTYTLASYSGTQVSLNDFDFADSGTHSDALDGDTLTLVENGDNLQVIVTAPSTNFYFTGANNSIFSTGSNYTSDLAGTMAQTGTLSSTSDVFISANTETATPGAGPSVTAATTIDSLTFNSNGAGATVGGTATLTILGTNNSGVGLADTATGTTTETVSAPIALGATQSWSVASSGDTLNVSGQVSGAFGLTTGGAGTTALTNATGNTYSGGTTVSAGTLLVENTSNSATGTGSVTVDGGATLAGTGIINASAGSFSVTGTTTSNRANLLVGKISSTDTNTSSILTLEAAGASTIADANLSFNLNAKVAGGLGGARAGGLGVANSGTELSVGNTAISFGTGVSSVTLTLNMQDEPAIVAAFTPYVLIAGTEASGGTGADHSQYTGLSLGNVLVNSGGITETVISGNNLTLAFGNSTDQSYYGTNSYLVLYQNTNTGVDDIDVVVVPEPGTWAMMLGGLGALLFLQRVRRKDRS